MSSTVLHKFPHIRISIPLSTKHAHDQCNENAIGGFSLLSNQYISNIPNLYNPDVNLSLSSQMICDHMFSDPKSDNIFPYFWLRTWFIFCFFYYFVFYYLIWSQEIVRIYCRWVPDWIELTRARVLSLSKYITVTQNKIQNTNWITIPKYHRVIRQQGSRYLDSLIETASRAFSPRVFARSYHPISQTSSTRITCWTHWFHHRVI